MPPNFARLPPEILLNIAGFLSDNDVTSFHKVIPNMRSLVTEGSFHRWERLLGKFTFALNRALDDIAQEKSQQEQRVEFGTAAQQPSEPAASKEFDTTVFPKILADMQITRGDEQLQLDDIFAGLERLGGLPGQPMAPLVESCQLNEGSKRLQSALEVYAPMQSIIALLPAATSRNLSSMQPPIADRILVTAYLLYTKLQPRDVLHLLPRFSRYGYISEQALAEYFAYLLLFIRISRLENDLWPDAFRSIRNEAVDRTKWVFTNGSHLSGYGLQFLQRGIESWFVSYYEPHTPFSSDPKNVTLTSEQRLFVESNIKTGEIFKVRAYAGTGKTKCLVDYAKRRPHKKILYVAYNRQAKHDADFKFKDCYKVDCKTLHSVAYSALSVVNPAVYKRVHGIPTKAEAGSQSAKSRRGKFSRIESAPTDDEFLRNWDIDSIIQSVGFTLEDIAPVFTTPYNWQENHPDWVDFQGSAAKVGTPKNPKNPENLARVIATAVDRFCQSNDSKPEFKHISLIQCRTKLCNPTLALPWMQRFWKKIMAGESRMMTHDCYLKMFSITKDLDADKVTFGKYDIVMFDEAQDANPCMASIIVRQKEASGIIIIGDPYQMIYGFRGARNECFDDEKVPPNRTFHLTKSFRFGQEIADVANLILGRLGETTPVRGGNPNVPSPAVFLPPLEATNFCPPPSKHTVIFRSNSELVKYFFKLFGDDPNKLMCLKTSATNAASAIIPLIRSGYYLFKGKSPKHPRLRGVRTFDEAKSYVRRQDTDAGLDTDEVDIQALSLIVGMERFYSENTNEGQFLAMLKSSEECIVDFEGHADVVLSTAHQSKGLEWDDVIVADDMLTESLSKTDSAADSGYRSVINLIYVACTRARKRLQVPHHLAKFIEHRVARYRFFLSPPNQNQQNELCPCCKGKLPTNSFMGDLLSSNDEKTSTDSIAYFSTTPSPCIGYEALVPRRDPTAPDGWIEYSRRPLNPLQIPKCVYLPSITCVNCVLAWRYLANLTHENLYRFASLVKLRLAGNTDTYHGDFAMFWSLRFGTRISSRLPYRGERMKLVNAYHGEMRGGLQRRRLYGVKECSSTWSAQVSQHANDAGVEYDDDDVDDFIMGYNG
ncbi:hypothetical protein ABW19_dt0207936 [Dactylella cylindrospora]|nr:hypothetical protein ABW19_dt0207936 [Dactylella cylindrospora]